MMCHAEQLPQTVCLEDTAFLLRTHSATHAHASSFASHIVRTSRQRYCIPLARARKTRLNAALCNVLYDHRLHRDAWHSTRLFNHLFPITYGPSRGRSPPTSRFAMNVDLVTHRGYADPMSSGIAEGFTSSVEPLEPV